MKFVAAQIDASTQEKLRLQLFLSKFREGLKKISNHEDKVTYLHTWKKAIQSLQGEVSEYEIHHLMRFINIIDALIAHHRNNIK